MNIKEKLTEQDFKEMEALEKKYYSAEFIADYQDALSWYTDYPFTTIAAEDSGKIIGFLEIFPISADVYEMLQSGLFNDKYLQKKDIININEKPEYPLNLFLSCIVVDKAYRSSGILQMLLSAYGDLYQRYIDNGVVIDKIITDNVTEAGEKFSKKMGFEKWIETDHGSVVYVQSFKHFLEALKIL